MEMKLHKRKDTFWDVVKRGIKDLLSIPRPIRIEYNTTKAGVHTAITKYKNKTVIEVINSIH